MYILHNLCRSCRHCRMEVGRFVSRIGFHVSRIRVPRRAAHGVFLPPTATLAIPVLHAHARYHYAHVQRRHVVRETVLLCLYLVKIITQLAGCSVPLCARSRFHRGTGRHPASAACAKWYTLFSYSCLASLTGSISV